MEKKNQNSFPGYSNVRVRIMFEELQVSFFPVNFISSVINCAEMNFAYLYESTGSNDLSIIILEIVHFGL